MSEVKRFWCDEARNIRCVREDDYDALASESQARAEELAQALRHLLHNIKASGKRIDLGLAKECAEAALARFDSTAPGKEVV
ncbi:hypothetical protein PAK_P30128 [Pseudomonas phage PAK_P3]|uniref:Uncharacterized protein n=2 Tax=Nankokuvirus PAKP3 TaxID=1925782 RepID=F2W6C1_9CAUD|nr:hypothetical protein PAK_P30128 [Pseudomonas phage PAK_P3]ADX32141.1 hypothetical protein P3_CHA0130 [Pseudomonas phage P3_CHA]ADX32326.1 hypothetical protein PAK_P30128 [Pseudomonas phage PAK_P3]